MRSRVLAYRIRLRWRLDRQHANWSSPFHDRGKAEWWTFVRKREQMHLDGRYRWRRAMGLPYRRPLYGWFPFHTRGLAARLRKIKRR